MSLGVFWSLLNPLVMMGVLWFVFTQIFPNNATSNFAVFALCGIVPYNFFSLSWAAGTSSLVAQGSLIKRVNVPREIFPIATVLSVCIHLFVQVALLIVLVFAIGKQPTVYWLLLPPIWAFTILFVCGLALASSALNVYVRDMRYIVESANTVIFWLVPIFYPFSIIPERYRDVYQYNPIAALVLATRNILLDGVSPPKTLLVKLAFSSILVFGAGFVVFQRLKKGFYEKL